ncbi:hypothetical protein MAR_024308 [Mya arenaria]|uniref:DUF4537 domain-containing protein n=1 Tax=Mya arenaria TaxID=6604 RepID=A0ABY7DYD7_MYAAR|nr:hypothetical protein MAR_024308 [Mya arenaria]
MAKRVRGTSALVYNKEDELFYPGNVEGTLQKGDNQRYFYNVRLSGDDTVVHVDRDDVEFRGGAVPWRQLKRTTLHVSRLQIRPLGADAEEERPKTAPQIRTVFPPEIPATRDQTVQAPESEPVSGVVLARWREDGWYYFGKVVSSRNSENVDELGHRNSTSDNYTALIDGLGNTEKIHKSDILTETNQKFQVVQPGDKVIALHPNYAFSYAPATVKRVYRMKGADLKFYDNTVGTLPWSEIYKISQQKYTDCVHHIEQKENEMLQKHVIVLDEKCGHFESGTVSDYVCNQMYNVTMTERNEAGHLKQQSNHMFIHPSIGVDLKNSKYVLGRVNDIFLPGEIFNSMYTNGNTTPDETITVRFCNHEESSVCVNDVYPINENYFDYAVQVWNSCQ